MLKAAETSIRELPVKELLPRLASVLLAVALGAQLLAFLTDGTLIAKQRSAGAAPPRALRSADSFVPQIVAAHLFGAAPVAAAADGAADPFDLVLQGTIAGDDPTVGRAIIRMHDQKARMFAPGGDVDSQTRLLRVYVDRVVLDYQGSERTLALPHGGLLAALLGPIVRPLVRVNEEPEEVHELQPGHPAEPVARTANYAAIAEYAEFLPASGGVKVMGVKDPDEMAKIGLQEGDVITAMNGEPIRNPGQVAALLERLSHGGAVNVSVERNGQANDLELQAVN
jgi:type II secretion system protein C